ncbi:hypothetical protein V6N11_039574 [Hibiscus sabdariffa]|uniref:Uncharacterized protein n=1 Tax=Hibiscus sabdariffa TaxID=183260 RepID=A0ABR2SNC0_9ROSI
MVAADILFHLPRSTLPETAPKSHENGLEASAPPPSAAILGDLSAGKGYQKIRSSLLTPFPVQPRRRRPQKP